MQQTAHTSVELNAQNNSLTEPLSSVCFYVLQPLSSVCATKKLKFRIILYRIPGTDSTQGVLVE